MSLLLDALKKATEEKNQNNSEDNPTATGDSDDTCLDLDMQALPGSSSVNADSVKASDDENNASTDITGDNGQSGKEQASQKPFTTQPDKAENEPAVMISPPEPGIENIGRHKQTTQDKDVLTFLIDKSNQQSKVTRFRRRLIYGSLTTLLVLVLGIFSYLKLLAVSEQLYRGHSAEPNRSQPVPVKPAPPKTSVVEKLPEVHEVKVRPVAKQPVAAEKGRSIPVNRTARQERIAPAKNQPVTIVHKKITDPTDDYLRQAYRHFNGGRYEAANDLYTRILEREPKNRDALLGVAAIAMKQNRLEYARQKYLYLLHLNPKDTLAKAGLSALESHINPDLNESQLKLMLSEQPDAAHLYFALGSLYAAREKWADAQSAFFSAWAADSSHADYAFNLAVSLDHMGKAEQAIEFYQKSLDLNINGRANFSEESVQKRISFLKGRDE